MYNDDTTVSLMDFFLSADSGGGPAGLVLLLTSWLVGYCGLGTSFVFFVSFFAYYYWYRQTRRLRRQVTYDIQKALREPHLARAILGNNIPHWVNFSTVERCEWIQDSLVSLWPYVAKALKTSIINSLDPMLEKYRPQGLLSSLQMGVVDLGDVPPTLEGFHCHHKGETETIIDIHMQWYGNPIIRVNAEMGPVAVEASVANLQVTAMMRITLGPHCTTWPCFRSMSISFMGKPLIDFNLTAAKIPFDAVPGLSTWLDGFIRNTLSWLLVYPRRIIIPVLSGEQVHMQEIDVEPIGCLIVYITAGHNLPEASLFKSTSTYVRVTCTLGDESKNVTYRTRCVKGSDPIYDDNTNNTGKPALQRESCTYAARKLFSHKSGSHVSEAYSSRMIFAVYHVPSEQLSIEVIQASGRKSKALMISSDSIIGHVELLIGSLLGSKYVTTSRLVCPENAKKCVGKISFTTEYKTFIQFDSDENNSGSEQLDGTVSQYDGSVINTPNGSIPSTLSDGSNTHHNASKHIVASIIPSHHSISPTENGSQPISHQLPKCLSGLLLIYIDKCTNVIAGDAFNSSDPYVVFRVGIREVRTAVIYNTLDPRYDAKLQIPVEDVSRDVLQCFVYDHDKLDNDDLLGKLRVSIAEVHRNRDRMPLRGYKLDTRGAVHFSLKLKCFFM